MGVQISWKALEYREPRLRIVSSRAFGGLDAKLTFLAFFYGPATAQPNLCSRVHFPNHEYSLRESSPVPGSYEVDFRGSPVDYQCTYYFGVRVREHEGLDASA